MSLGRRHARWVEKTREHCTKPPDIPRDAVRAFRTLPLRRQLTLVEEIVATRRQELCRAFPDVANIAEGFRHRGSVTRRTRRIVREPCVTFVVAEKKARRRVDPDDRVPSHLLTYGSVGRTRVLYAVPTDVEDGRERAAVRPHGPVESIEVATTGTTAAVGAIGCVITRTTAAARIPYAMSCKHVFSLSKKLGVGEVVGARIAIEQDSDPIGETLRVSGRLSDVDEFCLDSQLAEVLHEKALVRAIGVARPTRWAKTKTDILQQTSYVILTPRRRLVARPKEIAAGYVIDYEHAGLHAVRHRQVVLSTTNDPPEGGDSGSPVVTTDGRMLLGMHIAGNEDTGLCVMIPAWALLSRFDYQHVGSGESWALW
jgi:hypothetical protein